MRNIMHDINCVKRYDIKVRSGVEKKYSCVLN